jgi:hypothetical protein
VAELLDLDRLTLFLFFAVPGFITMKVYDLIVPAERRNFGEAVVDVVSYSIINLALFGWWLLPLVSSRAPEWYGASVYAVLFVTPAVLGVLAVGLRQLPFLRGKLVHPTPTGWDHFFGQGQPCWILFHLQSGRKIGGYYGAGSLASSYPQPPEVYVEEVWELDEQLRFRDRKDQTLGLIIAREDCEFIELFVKDEERDHAESATDQAGERRGLRPGQEGVPAQGE